MWYNEILWSKIISLCLLLTMHTQCEGHCKVLRPLCLFFNTASSGAVLSACPLQSIPCKHPIGSIHYRPNQWERQESAKPTQTNCAVHHCKCWHTMVNLVILVDHCHFLHCLLITNSIFALVIFCQWDVYKIHFVCSFSLKKLKKANFLDTNWAFSIIQHLWHKMDMILQIYMFILILRGSLGFWIFILEIIIQICKHLTLHELGSLLVV